MATADFIPAGAPTPPGNNVATRGRDFIPAGESKAVREVPEAAPIVDTAQVSNRPATSEPKFTPKPVDAPKPPRARRARKSKSKKE